MQARHADCGCLGVPDPMLRQVLLTWSPGLPHWRVHNVRR